VRNAVLVGVLGLVSCGPEKPEIERLADEACACTTQTCAEAVNRKREAAFESRVMLGGSHTDPATAKKLDGHMRRLATCLVEFIPLDKL